jgi:hypothetical protein
MLPSRIARERKTAEIMISLFCGFNHSQSECSDCRRLLNYVLERLEKCPFQEAKPTCAKCSVHCYKPEMREKIREVMRFSGPRMLYHHPILAVQHLIDSKRKYPLKSRPSPAP